jgi:hypothetical protein
MDQITRLIKYSIPTKFDKGAYGLQWSSFKEDQGVTHYIQVSEDPENPEWITFGEFFETILSDDILDLTVAEMYLNIYKNKTNSL